MKTTLRTTVLATLVVALLLTACGGATARTPEGIVAAFKAAGLEAENSTAMGPGDYGLGPYVAKGVHFFIPSLGPDNGGRAFVGTQEEIASLQHYYESLGKASAVLFCWVFVTPDGKAMVQINGDLPEDQAKKYEEALK